jgi:hypothetical protein
MSAGIDTLKGANVSKCIPRPLLANSCEIVFSECGIRWISSFREARRPSRKLALTLRDKVVTCTA